MFRKFVVIAMLIFAGASCGGSMAQERFPNRPVRLIIGFPPGGATDVLARALANKLTERWGQSVVVDNKPGGNTVIAALETVRAKPDGYTLSLVLDLTLVMNQHLFKSPKYDPEKDFSPISGLAEFPLVMMSRGGPGADTFQQFVESARQRPAETSVGTASMLIILAQKKMNAALGIDPLLVQYKGTGDATIGLMRGDINFQLDVDVSAAQFIQKGQLKALAVTGPKRLPAYPSVPTLSELGIGQATTVGWFALVGPRGMAPDLVKSIHDDLAWAMADQKLQAYLLDKSIFPNVLSTSALQDRIKRDSASYGEIIRKNNLSFD